MVLRVATQVLEGGVSNYALSKVASSSILTSIGNDRVELSEGTTSDWSTLPLQKVLPVLCEEAPNFAREMTRVVEKSGLRALYMQLLHIACTAPANFQI